MAVSFAEMLSNAGGPEDMVKGVNPIEKYDTLVRLAALAIRSGSDISWIREEMLGLEQVPVSAAGETVHAIYWRIRIEHDLNGMNFF